MKTRIIQKILFVSGLCCMAPASCLSQEWMFRVHAAEISAKMPALSCFIPMFSGFHFRNDFGIKEMMFAEVLSNINLRKNILLFAVSHYGYANYGDFKMTVGYGRNFGDRFAMTARIFYLMAHARGYPPRHSLCVDFSFACKVTPKLQLCAAVYNPFLLHYGVTGQEVIPLEFAVGCTYMPVRKLLLSLTMSKSLPGAWELVGRFMTHPVSPLLLAIDCSNSYFGVYIGLIYKKFLVSVQANCHYRISVSPEIGGWWFGELKR